MVRLEKVLALLGQLSKALKSVQLQSINKILANLDGKSKRALRSYYGFLLQRLSMNSPKKALAKLISQVTDASTVTQARIDHLCSLYVRDPHPAFADVLRAMRAHAPSHIYFPPIAMPSAEYACIPPVVSAKLSTNDLDTMVPVYTRIASILFKGTPVSNASVLAQLYPLAHTSCTIMLPIEEYFYRFLAGWDGRPSPVVNILAKYLRFWPEVPPKRLKSLVLDPLSRIQSPQSILPDVVDLGKRGEPLVAALLAKIDTLTPHLYVALVLYYIRTGLEPPSDFVYRLIVEFPALLFICRQWASSVPAIKNALQGEYGLETRLGPTSVEDFALANNPWLGNITIEVFEEMTDSPCSGKITESLLEKQNVSYEDFCNYLLDKLANFGLYIDEYLG